MGLSPEACSGALTLLFGPMAAPAQGLGQSSWQGDMCDTSGDISCNQPQEGKNFFGPPSPSAPSLCRIFFVNAFHLGEKLSDTVTTVEKIKSHIKERIHRANFQFRLNDFF